MDNRTLDSEFDYDSISGKEIEEMMDELFVDLLATKTKNAPPQESISIVNQQKVRDIRLVYTWVKNHTRNLNVEVSYKMYQPLQSMGVVTIIGDELIFTESDWIIKAGQIASNMDVYPTLDRKIRIDFTFHGLTVKIG